MGKDLVSRRDARHVTPSLPDRLFKYRRPVLDPKNSRPRPIEPSPSDRLLFCGMLTPNGPKGPGGSALRDKENAKREKKATEKWQTNP